MAVCSNREMLSAGVKERDAASGASAVCITRLLVPGTGSSARPPIHLMKPGSIVWLSVPHVVRRETSPAPTGLLVERSWKRLARCETILKMAHEPVLSSLAPCPRPFSMRCWSFSPDPILGQRTIKGIRVTLKTARHLHPFSRLVYSRLPSTAGLHCASEQ